jgi:hypothetical protein
MPVETDERYGLKYSEDLRKKVFKQLRKLAGRAITEDNMFRYHDQSYVVVPRGMSKKKLAQLAASAAQADEEKKNYVRQFNCRPMDGAHALQETLRKVWGFSGRPSTVYSFFGASLPSMINVKVDYNESIQIPFGEIDFPPLEGTFNLGVNQDPRYGPLFQVVATVAQKYEGELEGFWVALEEEIKTNSIYRGKAMHSVTNVRSDGHQDPQFLDLESINPELVAYSQDVLDELETSVWGPIRNAEHYRKDGVPVGTHNLLFGDYGTGKTLAGGLTAKIAVENGWTYIQCDMKREDYTTVLKWAELLAPCVVFMEDADNLIKSDAIAELLESFDGISAKGKEVMVLMTSNFLESLTKGMTRPGRIDNAIEIGDLDEAAIQKLISGHFRRDGMLDPNIDFAEVREAMRGYTAAFIINTFDKAKASAINRTGGTQYTLTTEDFVRAAGGSTRRLHDTHRAAVDKPKVDTFGEAFRGEIGEAVRKHRVDLQESGDLVVIE